MLIAGDDGALSFGVGIRGSAKTDRPCRQCRSILRGSQCSRNRQQMLATYVLQPWMSEILQVI